MPRKQWSGYEKVTAADVNTYLSDQSVMRFASSSARSTAIPSPTEGMVTWLDDTNALQVYDGSAWVAVISGTLPNPLGAGDPLNMASLTATPTTGASNTWYEVTSSMPVDALIYSVSFIEGSATAQGDRTLVLGTGGSGSEVIRWLDCGDDTGPSSSVLQSDFTVPWGMYVPSGTRVAFKVVASGGGFPGTTTVTLRYVSVLGGTQVEAGPMPANFTTYGTGILAAATWYEVATTPPKASGVWVTGVRMGGLQVNKLRFGLGGSGSEVAASAYVAGSYYGPGSTLGGSMIQMQPFFWPASTRLAFMGDAAPDQFRIAWRETLS